MQKMTGQDLNFANLKYFSASEWPDGVLEHMDSAIIVALNDLRGAVPADHYMVPSPVPEAHVRHEGTSRHSTQGGKRLSDATDVFADWSTVWNIWAAAQRMHFGGIGLYLDTYWNHEKRPMLHFDLRAKRLLWVRSGGRYIYHNQHPVAFHWVIGQEGRVK